MKNNNNSIQNHGLGVRATRNITNAIIYIFLIAISIVWLFPFVGIVLESLRCESTGQVGYFWPKQFGFDNYIRLFQTEFPKWLKFHWN